MSSVSWDRVPRTLARRQAASPQTAHEENVYENARLYCKVGESEKGIAEAKEQQTLIPGLVKRIPHHRFVYVGLMPSPMIDLYKGLLAAQRAAPTVPVSALPSRVSQLPLTGK